MAYSFETLVSTYIDTRQNPQNNNVAVEGDQWE